MREKFEKAVCPACRRLVDCRRADRFYLRVLEHDLPSRWAAPRRALGLGNQCAGTGRLVLA